VFYDTRLHRENHVNIRHHYHILQILTSNCNRSNFNAVPCLRHLYSGRLLEDQDRFFTRVIDLPTLSCCDRQQRCSVCCCERKTRYLFVNGIIPALNEGWLLFPSLLGPNYQLWHNHVYNSLALMIATMPYDNHRSVVITVNYAKHQINLTFVPPKAPRPIQIEQEGFQTFVEQATTVLPDSYYYNGHDDTNNDFDWYDDFYRGRNQSNDWTTKAAWRNSLYHLQLNPSQQNSGSNSDQAPVDALAEAALWEPDTRTPTSTPVPSFSYKLKDPKDPSQERIKARPNFLHLVKSNEIKRLLKSRFECPISTIKCLPKSRINFNFEEASNTSLCTDDSSTNSLDTLDDFNEAAWNLDASPSDFYLDDINPTTEKAYAVSASVQDPSLEQLGKPCLLTNWLMDSGATSHMTPRLADLEDVEEGLNLGIEVADGHIIHCTKSGKVRISMIDDNGIPLDAFLVDTLYVPGLNRRLFSITKFASLGHAASIQRNSIRLLFGEQSAPVTITHNNFRPLASDATTVRTSTVPSLRHAKHNTKKHISLEIMHNRLKKSSRALLTASDCQVWADAVIRMAPDRDCANCRISTIRASPRNFHETTKYKSPGDCVFSDILPRPCSVGLTPATTPAFLIIFVDAYSRLPAIYPLLDKTTEAVIEAKRTYEADHRTAVSDFLSIQKFRADAGTQYSSAEFQDHCIHDRTQLSLAAPKKQSQNHYAERTWATIQNIAGSMLVHARLPDNFLFHALLYATKVFSVLPVTGLLDKNGNQSTPYQLFYGQKPRVAHFRVFGCPTVVKKWTATIEGRRVSNQTQRGIRGIFIGFPRRQNGYLIYVPTTRTIVVSDDVSFDESFFSAIATTWRQFNDSLAIRPDPSTTFIPDPSTSIEQTGSIESMFQDLEEGNADSDATSTSSSNIDDASPSPNTNPTATSDDEAEFQEEFEPPLEPETLEAESPLVVDDSATRPKRKVQPPNRLTFSSLSAVRSWKEKASTAQDLELFSACSAEVDTPIDIKGCDPSPFIPPPPGIRNVTRMQDLKIRQAWLAAYKKELKTLIDSGTFSIEPANFDDKIIPTMETNRVKIASDGTLDKLKVRIVVRGDLQSDMDTEDKWSPTASFRALKMFLANCARHKVRVRQLDFIGAYLQAKTRHRIFIRLPTVYGDLWPEYKNYSGVPLRLVKSMYGMTLSGKYWWQELQEFLVQEAFAPSTTVPCFFSKHFPDGSFIKLLNYVDDLLYASNSPSHMQAFEESLSKRFSIELMGQAHWYLSSRITQEANYNISIDQSRYCLSVVKRYLDTAGCAKVNKLHSSPLPSEFIPTADDCSPNQGAVKALEERFNIAYDSCVGALIYLAQTRPDIAFAVNKLAKFSRSPGIKHFEAILHLLRYLRDNIYLGLRFYSDVKDSPIYKNLRDNNINETGLLLAYSDSSWHDDVDSGRSTGCYLIAYMGGIVDHSSNMPGPVAMSSAEAEYNEACLATMGLSHIQMFENELENQPVDATSNTNLYLDNISAIAMGRSFRDTKHTRHILRRYHFVRTAVENKRLTLAWIPTEFQLADLGTKILSGARTTFLTSIIMTEVPEKNSQDSKRSAQEE